MIACIIGISDKFLDDEYVEKFMEVINMSRIFQTIISKAKEEGEKEGKIAGKREGIREGKKEGIKEGEVLRSQKDMQKFLLRKFGLKSSQLKPKIIQLDDLEVLDFVLEELFGVTNWEEAVAVINDGIRSLPVKDEKK